MKTVFQKMLAEWERCLLLASLLFAAVMCATVIADLLSDDAMTMQTNNTIPPVPSYLNRQPQEALDPPVARPEEEASNPFLFSKSVRRPPKPQPKQQPAQPPKGGGGKTPPAPPQANPPKQAPQQQPPPKGNPSGGKQPAALPPRTLTVIYRGLLETADGKRMAFLTTVDSKDKKTASQTLTPGAALREKITIVSADQTELKLNSNGNIISIPNGRQSTFQIDN